MQCHNYNCKGLLLTLHLQGITIETVDDLLVEEYVKYFEVTRHIAIDSFRNELYNTHAG